MHSQYNFTNFWILPLRESLAIELKIDGDTSHTVGFLWQGR